jgi:hypothetical protein
VPSGRGNPARRRQRLAPHAPPQPRQRAPDVGARAELHRLGQRPRRAAPLGDGESEDVSRLLPHAQVGDQHPRAVLPDLVEALAEGRDALHAVDAGDVPLERAAAVEAVEVDALRVVEKRPEALVIMLAVDRDDAPQQGVERRRRDQHAIGGDALSNRLSSQAP